MENEITYDQLNEFDNILIWGAGYHTEEVLRFYKPFFERKHFWITDKNKVGQSIAGYRILASDEIDYKNISLTIIMSALYHDEIENTLRGKYDYHGPTIGLYLFRRILLELDSYEECKSHLKDFICHMENGIQSYSYDYVYKEKFAHYKKIKLFAWLASSIGEAIRYLGDYYYNAFQNKPKDQYYLLIPYINVKDFANGRFIEIVSRTIPMITYENCRFWEYLLKKYPERFDYGSYNDYNKILVNEHDHNDPRLCVGCFCDIKLPVISYTLEEEKEAADYLKSMGVSGEFVCIFARDGAYWQKQTENPVYAFDSMRDMNIRSFESAEEYLSEKGIKTIRMGKVVGGPAELPNCIDYATKCHSDLMDVYLLAKCKFYAGTISGIVALAQMQGVPVVSLGVVNLWGQHSIPYRSTDIYVPKKLYSKKKKRFLSFVEMWDVDMATHYIKSDNYQKLELEFVECSQEEIREAIVEMNEKIDGVYLENEQEKELQKRYHTLLDKWIERHGYNRSQFLACNISGSFIKKNAFLLEEHDEIGKD